MSAPLTVTVLVTTYNRKAEIGCCLDSVLRQDYPCEVLVLDDASSDGTTEFVRENYPQVRIDRVEKNVGLIGQRTRGGQLATGDIVISIDDDIELMAADTVSRVVAAFDAPDIAAVTFPSIDVRKGPRVLSDPPSSDCRYATAEYRGGVVGMRRDVFNALGGYDARLYRQGEEMDLAIRLYAAGYVVVMAHATPVHHYEAPHPMKSTAVFFRARNTMLFCWWRLPWASIPLYVAVRTFNLLKLGVRLGFPLTTLRGIAAGHWLGLTDLASRNAPSRRVFKTFEWLRRSGPQPLDEVRRRIA